MVLPQAAVPGEAGLALVFPDCKELKRTRIHTFHTCVTALMDMCVCAVGCSCRRTSIPVHLLMPFCPRKH